MNIFHKVSLQSLKKNRTRTFVTIVGVALSAALFTAVATFGTSLIQYLIQGSISKSGDWHVQFADVDAPFIQDRSGDGDVIDTFSYENIGYALLDGAKSPEKPYLFLAGFTDRAFDKLPIHLISGRLPESPEEILIPNHIAIKAGVRIPVGQSLHLAVGRREKNGKTLTQLDDYAQGEKLTATTAKTYIVVGTYERAGFEGHSAPGYTVITKPHSANRYSLFITLDNPRKTSTYTKSYQNGPAYALNENILRFYGASDNRIFNAVLFSVGGVVAAIILVSSVFLIYNAFHISLNERTHQFGILMSVGATAKQLRNSVLFEGTCIGLLGIPFGMAAGIGGVALLLPLVARNFATMSASDIPLVLSVSVPALAAAAAVSLVTIYISAYIPARRAAATPVMECIRQTNEIKTQSKDMRISRLARSVYGLEGILALKNFRRNKRRYRSVVLSLTLSVALFVSGNAFGGTLKAMAKKMTVEVDGDISFYTQQTSQDELLSLYHKLKNTDGVKKSTWQTNAIYSCTTDDLPADFVSAYGQSVSRNAEETFQAPLYAQFIEDDIYYPFIESLGFSREEYSGRDGKTLSLVMDASEHETFFENQSMAFTLLTADGSPAKKVSTTVVNSYPLDMLPFDSMPRYVFLMVAPWSMKADFDGLETSTKSGLTFWTDTPSQTLAQIQDAITKAGVTYDYTLVNLSAAVDLFRSLTFVVDVFTYAFVAMISLIAVANVFNTISTNIRIRRRELAMLRSVGMSPQGFNRMMHFECLFYGLRTLLFGVPLASILSWLLYKAMIIAQRMEDFPYRFPLKSMAISVLGVFAIVFLTMLYATGKIRKENIIDALKNDQI